MTDRTTAFARAIVAGELVAGELELAACRRHLDDIENGAARGLEWRPAEAEAMIAAYPANFTITDGPRAGEPFDLLDWMMFVTGSLFGWFKTDPEGNTRWRFDEAYIETAKGQGKSPWMAATGLIAIGGLGRKRAQAIVTGPKDEQALITLGDAAAMVRATMPGEDDGVTLESEGKFKVRGMGAASHTVEHLASGGVFKTMSGKATQLSGPRPDVVFVDEVHELHTVALIDMHQAALAKNPRGGLLIACSNTPAQTQGVGTFYSERAQRVVKGLDFNDSLMVYITRVDIADRETVFDTEGVWRKSMPALGVTFPKENVRREVSKARVNPSEANRVKRLYFGIPTGAVDFWLDDPTLWENAQALVDEKALVNCPCWLSLDLSDKHDLTALTAAWAVPIGMTAEGHEMTRLVTKTWYWTCEANLDERARKDQMPYELWRDQGFLNVVPGASITKDFIALEVARIFDEQLVQFLAYDVAKMASFIEACDRVGFAVWKFRGDKEKPGQGLMLVPHGQGLRISFSEKQQLSMPISVEELEDRLRLGTIVIDANPITTACASNAAPISDFAGNRAFDKSRSRGRIDGLVTLAMAAGAAAMKTPKPRTSVYEKRGIITL
jgi:phage terminase large subunit-like protein